MDTDTKHETDRFTALMIFACDHDFPTFAAQAGIQYKSVMGFYQGIIEASFVVAVSDAEIIAEARMLKGQETVLLLTSQEAMYNGQRDAYLGTVTDKGYIDPDGEYIGKWYKVSTNEALHSDAWTCYPEDNDWFVAKMPEADR